MERREAAARLLTASLRLQDAVSADVADQRRRPYERKILRGARAMFRDQRDRVLDWLDDNRGRFAEAVGPDDFERVWASVSDATSGPLANLLDELAPDILERGWADGNADVGMGLSFDVGHPRATEYLHQLGARRVTQIDRETRRQLAKILADGVDEGWSYDRTSRAIRERFDSFSRQRAHMIAVTESADAYEHGQWMHRADLGDRGIQTEVAWLAEGDACVICMPNPSVGYIAHNESFPSGHHRPPAHPRCVPAGTLVSGPAPVGSSVRWFDGDLIDIVTASGRKLSATPNHPVLTPDGWVAAGLLERGGHVVCGALGEGVASVVDPDDDEQPALIEDVARTLGGAVTVPSVRVPTSAEDFHGDGLDGEVAVVRADGALRSRDQSAGGQPVSQQPLCRRHAELATLPSHGALALFLEGVLTSASSVMGSLRVAVMLLGGALLHHDPVGLGRTAQVDPMVGQDVGDGAAAYPVPLREDILRHTSEVVVDELVSVGRRPFGGHVYNLQTDPGWYIGNGIVTHNCRCGTVTRVAARSRVSARQLQTA